jgi:CheY-like chemotaxis protein
MSENRPIILVEDDARDLELTLAVLERYSLHNPIIVARDGVEALDCVYRRNAFASRPPTDPAVMLLDLKLPKTDGLEVMRILKSDNAQCHIPIVMLSASGEARDISETYQIGGNAFVVKPLDFQDFSCMIQAFSAFWIVHNRTPGG